MVVAFTTTSTTSPATDLLLPNGKADHQADRAVVAYEFLTAAARLFIDHLVSDGAGGWKHETETKTLFNRITPLEQFHHLFCNMTRVPTFAAIIESNGQQQVISDINHRPLATDPAARLIQMKRIFH